MDYATHNDRMVAHLLWLDEQDKDYARYALDAYRKNPGCPNPHILTDVKAEQSKRLSLLAPESK